MPHTFSVLKHPERDNLIDAIMSDASVRDIARQFGGLDKSAVARFRKFYQREHAIEIDVASKEAAKAAVHASGDALHEALDLARSDDDTRALIAAARSLDDHALTLGKIGGWLSDNVNITDGNDARLQSLLKYAVAELAPIPGAVEALERAISKLDGDAAKDITPDSDVIEAQALEAGE